MISKLFVLSTFRVNIKHNYRTLLLRPRLFYFHYNFNFQFYFSFISIQEANKYFLAEFGKYFIIKRIPRYKLHPQYKNDLVELIIGKPIRKSKK